MTHKCGTQGVRSGSFVAAWRRLRRLAPRERRAAGVVEDSESSWLSAEGPGEATGAGSAARTGGAAGGLDGRAAGQGASATGGAARHGASLDAAASSAVSFRSSSCSARSACHSSSRRAGGRTAGALFSTVPSSQYMQILPTPKKPHKRRNKTLLQR